MHDETAHADTPDRIFGRGATDQDLSIGDQRTIIEDSLDSVPAEARVLAIIPDKTREDTTDVLFPIAAAVLARIGASKLDVLVAQGTHPPMTQAEKLRKIGISDLAVLPLPGQIFDHKWDDPEHLITIGTLEADEVERITGGLVARAVPLTVNALLARGKYDSILIFGATVPHEVVGFAGGAKYFFPGVSGRELTNITHWVGALAGIENTIGRIDTAPRRLINAAAAHIRQQVICFTSVVSKSEDGGLRTHALFGGDHLLSFARAAEVSRKVHIRYVFRKYKRVIAMLPPHYDDLWVGGKASYKLGGVIENGGELIIFAPHLREISATHGRLIKRFGYAPMSTVQDWVAADEELQANLSIAAHLTHVAFGSYIDEHGSTQPRYKITLSSGIDAQTCSQINLRYLAPRNFDLNQYLSDPDTLVVHDAGRELYMTR